MNRIYLFVFPPFMLELPLMLELPRMLELPPMLELPLIFELPRMFELPLILPFILSPALVLELLAPPVVDELVVVVTVFVVLVVVVVFVFPFVLFVLSAEVQAAPALATVSKARRVKVRRIKFPPVPSKGQIVGELHGLSHAVSLERFRNSSMLMV